MSFAPKLEMRQGQQLVMTPQLQQAIRLLQFSNLELTAYVETELERNPLLEREDGDDAPVPQRSDDDWTDAPDASADSADGLALDLKAPASEAHDAFDTAFENVFPEATPNDGGAPASQPGQTSGWENVRPSTHNGSGSDDNNFEDYVAAEVSLKDHLTAQVNLAVTDTAATNEDTVLIVVAPGVLNNDTDTDAGDTKSVVAVNGQAAAVGRPGRRRARA